MFSFHVGNSSEEHQRGPKPKRLKISIACNVCKAKKTKCDGARPVCGPCVKRRQSSQACIYGEAAPVSPLSNIPHIGYQKRWKNASTILEAERPAHHVGRS